MSAKAVPAFVHLNVHSEYSLADSLVRVDALMERVAQKGMGAVAITDASNMFAAIRSFRAASGNGIKPLSAAELSITSPWGDGLCGVIAQNSIGYRNLITLVSIAQTSGKSDGGTKVDWSQLMSHSEGLILLSGARHGLLGKLILESRGSVVKEVLDSVAQHFSDRFYFELQRTGHPDDDPLVQQTARIAKQWRIPVVATNAVLFLEKDDFDSHVVRAAIAKGVQVQALQKDGLTFTSEQYLKSPEEMADLFSDIPSAIENSWRIASRCSVEIPLGKSFLPRFETPADESEEQYLVRTATSGLEDRLLQLFPDADQRASVRAVYDERLAFELSVIGGMGFPGYFLIVADFIQWSKDNGIAVGPGRGSGAGSLVAYSLKITELDPLRYDLLFERFLNPERVSMPDFDIDFCMDNRDRVIDYVSRKYGAEAVSQIITYGTMAARMVVRDVARALGHPFGFADRLSKMIPDVLGITLPEALIAAPEMKLAYDTDPEVKEVINHSLVLEGLTRQVGKHAGGVLIAPTRLTDFTPIYSDLDGSGLVSQFDKDDVESAGLVKFDFLGLRTLTIIQWAVNSINARLLAKGLPRIDINQIDIDDRATFDVLQRCETTAVFQLESPGMKSLLKRLRPDNFEDIIALVALFRPGPLEAGMVDDFVNRKHGRAEVEYLHPLLEGILKNTYGVFVYQEQVMQTAQTLAGYTLGQADMLRRAMGKKKPEEMAKQREIFVAGSVANGIGSEKAGSIFDLMEKFAGYGFNKSHSAAYALIAYQTAWLKAHYPSEFMAAVLSSDMGKTEKVVSFVHETKKMGLAIVPPSINGSERQFISGPCGEIVYGLEGIKGLGGSALDEILHERKRGGPFKNVFDLCVRANPNKRFLEAAVHSGALDEFGIERSDMFSSIEKIQATARALKAKHSGQTNDLFADENESIEVSSSLYLVKSAPWSPDLFLDNERKVLGFYLTGHPLDQYRKELSGVCGALSEVLDSGMHINDVSVASHQNDREVVFAGLIVDSNVSVKSGGNFAVLKIDDGTRQVDVAVFNKAYADCMNFIRNDAVVVVEGTIRYDQKRERFRVIGNTIIEVNAFRDNRLTKIEILPPLSQWSSNQVEGFKSLRAGLSEGGCALIGRKIHEGVHCLLAPMRARITNEVLGSLKQLFGEDQIAFGYDKLKSIRSADLSEESDGEDSAERSRSRRARISDWLERATLAMS